MKCEDCELRQTSSLARTTLASSRQGGSWQTRDRGCLEAERRAGEPSWRRGPQPDPQACCRSSSSKDIVSPSNSNKRRRRPCLWLWDRATGWRGSPELRRSPPELLRRVSASFPDQVSTLEKPRLGLLMDQREGDWCADR